MLAPNFFSNKVVFIGKGTVLAPAGANTGDQYATPYTRWNGRFMDGVQIQASAFCNLVRRDWTEESAGWLEALALLTVGAAFGFGSLVCGR